MNALVVLASLIATTMAAGYYGGFDRSYGGWGGKNIYGGKGLWGGQSYYGGKGGWGGQAYYVGKGGWGGKGYYGGKGGWGGKGYYGSKGGRGNYGGYDDVIIAPIGNSHGGFYNKGFGRSLGYQLQYPQIQSQAIYDDSLVGGFDEQIGIISAGKGGHIGGMGEVISQGSFVNQGALLNKGGLINQGFGAPSFGPAVGVVNGFNGLQGMKTGLRAY